MQNKYRILVVEDDALVAEDICHTIAELGYDPVGPAYNCSDAKHIALREMPKLVLLDIHLEEKDSGINLGFWFNENFPIPIVFLTAFADSGTLSKAKKVHPEYYLMKPFTRLNLKIALEIAISNFYEPDLQQQKQVRYHFLNQSIDEPLSKREIQVINCVESGLSNKEIADSLYVSENTVKTHLKNIFSKMKALNRTDLIHKINTTNFKNHPNG